MAIAEPTLKKLTEHTAVFFHSTNIGVIECESGLYVIDSGSSQADGKKLAETLKALYPSKKIKALINTHSHSDHAGGNAEFIRLTRAELWTTRQEAVLLENPEIICDVYWGGTAFDELNTERYRCLESVRTDRIIDNQTIELDKDVTLVFIDLKGHYYSHTGLLVREKDTGSTLFFLGDALFGKELIKKTWLPFLMDPVEFRTSVGVIENTEADFYIPSHGNFFTRKDISAACEMNIILTLEAETLILKFLEAPRTQETLLKDMMDYAGINARLAQYIWIGVTIRSYLSSLEHRGLIEHIVEDSRLYWRKK